MSETVEFEINKQFKNFVVVVKNMSENREKSFYDAYGKDDKDRNFDVCQTCILKPWSCN